jgi:hypothetical protein
MLIICQVTMKTHSCKAACIRQARASAQAEGMLGPPLIRCMPQLSMNRTKMKEISQDELNGDFHLESRIPSTS